MDLELIGRLLGWATAATVALTGLWTYFGKSKDSAWTRLVSENDRVRRDLQEMKADLRSTNERLEKVESELEELRADRRTLMDFLRDVVSGQFPLDWIQTRAQELLTFNGAAAFRHMGHSRARPLSVHAFGAALDFDAAWNAYGVPLAQQQIDRDVIRVFQECGWEWGGLWSDPYEDGMHLQWTDPLPGVPQPAWRDAMARGEGSALKPKPTPV
ncbi:M15 family metallopeptidase, partial [Deinococcus sp. 6GRE01]|nr:M15 family metallopeptidase [Deinococcus sp. 6GRE01]